MELADIFRPIRGKPEQSGDLHLQRVTSPDLPPADRLLICESIKTKRGIQMKHMRKYLSLALAAALALTCLAGCSSGSSSSGGTSSSGNTSASGSTSSGGGSSSSGSGSGSVSGSGSSTPSAEGGTIKIALVAPLSGDNATYGVKQENGYRLAMDEINGNGGINGAQLVLETYDDAGDPATAASGAQKFADDDEVLVLGGCCLTNCTAAMLPITGDAGLPEMVVSSSAASLLGLSDYFYRMAVQDAQVGPNIARNFKDMGFTKAVALYPNNDYGIGLKDSFVEEFSDGGEVLDSIEYQAADQDYSAILTNVKDMAPDCIALCGTTTDSALIIKQAREMGIEAVMMGAPGVYNQNVIDIAGDAAEGIMAVGAFVANDPDEDVQAFVSSYKEKYNGETPDHFAALAYDQMYVIAEAAEKAMAGGELTRETMAAALDETNYEGITGTVTFNEDGEWIRDYMVLTVKDGEYVRYEG